MTQGLSGAFAFNGTNLTLQPTETRWGERESYGIDGAGHPIYPNVRTFEMTWQLISASDLSQLVNFFNIVSSTGTVVADLPKWGDVQYLFYGYSGCTLSEPVVSTHFAEHTQDVKLLILNIRTN